jgi:hypothetical protein
VGDEITEFGAPDLKSALADRRQMRPARDERDVVPRARKRCAIVATDRSRPENR